MEAVFPASNLLAQALMSSIDPKSTRSPRRNPLRPLQGNILQNVGAARGFQSPSKQNIRDSSTAPLISKIGALHISEPPPVTLLTEDVAAVVMRFIDMNTALKCRVVCKAWKKMVHDAGLFPIEEGLKGQELERGLQQHQLFFHSKNRELEVWTPEFRSLIANHMRNQDTVTPDMRRTLVNWLTEVHFKFRYREPSLHLAVELLDRYLSMIRVPRRRYQTVGVTSFLLGCKIEERISPQVGDLVYITDYSSSREDIVEMEKAMLRDLHFDLVLPKVWDFVPRLAAAAGLAMEQPRRGEHGAQLSFILYFVDLSHIIFDHCGRSPSLRVAVAVVCALRALRMPPRTQKIAFYAGIRDVQSLERMADDLMDNARSGGFSALDLKYSSQRFGGVSADGERGSAAKLRRFFNTQPASSTAQPALARPVPAPTTVARPGTAAAPTHCVYV